MGMISIGPLALPVTPVLLAAALLAALFVGRRAGAADGAQVESILYRIMLAGLLAARLAFIVTYWESYREAPLGMFDVRDGGFFLSAGLAAGAGVGLWHIWREAALRRALLWPLLAGGGSAALSGAAAMTLQQPRAGLELPDAAFNALDGSEIRLSALAGKPVVINLWATWCPPCRREMPALQQAQAQNKDVVFVFANQGESADTIRQYLAAENIDIANVILDRNMDVARHAGSAALPTTLFFDSRGKLHNTRMGQLSAASLAQQLEAVRRDGTE